jgi:hypothetical protein
MHLRQPRILLPVLLLELRLVHETLVCLPNRYIISNQPLQLLPREGFKTITVKRDVFRRFRDVKKLAKEENPDMCNSDFSTELLNLYERGRNNVPVATD